MRSSQEARAKGMPCARSQSMVSFLSAKPCAAIAAIQSREIAPGAGLEVRQELPLLLLLRREPCLKARAQNQRRVRAL